MRPIEILYVCTANVNRSAMAAALTSKMGYQRGLGITVTSASVMHRPGFPPPAHTLAVLRSKGIDASGHRSRTLDAAIVERADLVLTMERRHLRSAAVLAPDALSKTFSLKEFLRRGLAVGPRAAAEPLDGYLARLNADRDPQDLLGDDGADDVEDPQGMPLEAFERAADDLELLSQGVIYLLFGTS